MKELEQWLKAFGEFEEKHQIAVQDIPGIDLYIDQVTTFIDDNLHFFKRDDEDKILTKTMINNYTKQQVLPPPHNKKYSRAHMVLLILIYQLKQVLSIHDIQNLLMPHGEAPMGEAEKGRLIGLYEQFLTLQREQYQRIPEETQALSARIEKQLSGTDMPDKERAAYLLLVLCLVSQAAAQKLLAEHIIDTLFQPPAKEDKPKPEKDKEKDREKEKQKPADKKRPG